MELGDIVRLNYPGLEGTRGRLVEEVTPGLWAVEFHDGTADVFADSWLEAVK